MKLKRYVRRLLLLFPLALGIFPAEADAARAENHNGIPTVFLTVDPNEYALAMSSPDHSYRAEGGTVRIELPEGYGNEFGSVVAQAAGETLSLDYLRGRGNSTWLHDKRSFKIKLQKGADLLGMGKSKHWILLANAFDPSLLRNRLVLYM